MAEKQTLLTLPPEIFERISEHASPSDLKSLRLVCHAAEKKVLRTYTKALFEEQSFYLCSEKSLQLAATIATHKVFGPAIRKLYLMTETLVPWEHPQSYDLHYQYKTARQLRKGKRIHDAAHERFRKSQRERKRDLDHLFIILKRIGRLDSIQLTRLDTQGGLPARPMPVKPAGCYILDAGVHLLCLEGPHPNDDFVFVVEALARTSLTVSSFSVAQSYGYDHQHIWPVDLFDDHSLVQDFSTVLRTVQSLELDIHSCDHRDTQDVIARATTTMAAAPVLRSLALYSDAHHNAREDFEDCLWLRSLFARTIPRLEALSLTHVRVYVPILIDFVCRHKQLAFKRLDIKSSVLVGICDLPREGELPDEYFLRILGVPGSRMAIKLLDALGARIEYDEALLPSSSALEAGAESHGRLHTLLRSWYDPVTDASR